jgi:hypothetical protein
LFRLGSGDKRGGIPVEIIAELSGRSISGREYDRQTPHHLFHTQSPCVLITETMHGRNPTVKGYLCGADSAMRVSAYYLMIFTGTPYQQYIVQQSANLLSGGWIDITEETPFSDSVMTHSAAQTNSASFFRLLTAPGP